MTGPLADADGDTITGDNAVAQILAIDGAEGGTGVKTIEVAVDGDRTALERAR